MLTARLFGSLILLHERAIHLHQEATWYGQQPPLGRPASVSTPQTSGTYHIFLLFVKVHPCTI